MKTLETAVIFLALCRLVSPATSQEPPPNPEADIIRQLTSEGPYEWLEGVARGLAVPATERSPALLAAMIEALGREVEWKRHRTGPSDPSFEDVGEAFGESSAILARELAATGDPTILPALAWHAHNRGPVAQALYRFGHRAVPDLLAVAMSPEASGDIAREPLRILASIVSTYGPGGFEKQLVEAAMLHLSGPPKHYRSAWVNMSQIPALREAIALAGALRTPQMTELLTVLAASSPEEIGRKTNAPFLAEDVRRCAQAVLDGSVPDNSCDPRWWVDRERPR